MRILLPLRSPFLALRWALGRGGNSRLCGLSHCGWYCVDDRQAVIPYVGLNVSLHRCVKDPKTLMQEMQLWLEDKLNPDYDSDRQQIHGYLFCASSDTYISQ